MSSSVFIFCWIASLLNWVIIGPAIIFYAIQLFKLSSHDAISQRHLEFVWIGAAASVLFVCVSRPLSNFWWVYQPNSPIYVFVDFCLSFVTLDLAFSSFLTRGWLIYFDLKYALKNSSNRWMVIIDPNMTENMKQSWFVTHKSTYGNRRWLIFHRWLPLLITIITIEFIVTILDSSVNHSYMLVVFTFSLSLKSIGYVIFGLILWCKIPPFSDQFRMRWEFILFLRWGLFLICCALAAAVALMLAKAVDSPLTRIAANVFGSVMSCVFNLIPTFWVVYRSGLIIPIPPPIDTQSLPRYLRSISTAPQLTHITSLSYDTIEMEMDSASAGVKRITLKDILADDGGFYGFMNHLLSEFSSENLLAAFEMTQFQCYCRDTLNATPQTTFLALAGLDGLKSAIVYNDTCGAVEKASQLIAKYVVRGAEFELNLSFGNRQYLSALYQSGGLQSMTESRLISVFDRTMEEILLLIGNSYRRWQAMDEFQHISSTMHLKA